ncbi:AAA family ATPase [Pararhodospirillum oryzae]|uniref:Chromosome segregation protein SMC n=1 Tax=Pararhodospirillum oryzae TaxID=478448 RepID=A0A512H4B8_9PROT|nr:AAA family ATPase [Pararhodospirillum oryzae]GEO80287.1 chromosome segregation protein SMC [Pararhodospirillum oryzae]
MTPDAPLPLLNGRIVRLSVHGFRSLRAIEALELPRIAVLIGANGSGKSNVIRFLEMMSWMLRDGDLQEFVMEGGGGGDQFFMGPRQTPRIHAEIRIETDEGYHEYRFDLTHLSARDTVVIRNEAYRSFDKTKQASASWTEIDGFGKESTLPTLDYPIPKAICHLLGNCVPYHFHDTSDQAAIRLRWDVSDCVRLRSDGGNLGAVLLDLRENDPRRYQLITRQIGRVLPVFKDFVLEPMAGRVWLRWRGTQGDKTFGAHLTSDGSLRLFCLITLLNLPPERLPDVMLLDEPELGLHPHALALVAEMIKRVAEVRQIIIATQSPALVDCFDLENLIVARADNGETTLRPLARDQYQSWLDEE